jgi:GT2 family glycosyltransferase
VGGASLMARRSAIEAVGLLDEGYFMYAEEMDWCKRMWSAGWEVYSLPAARCLHWGGQSSQMAAAATPARLASAACRFFRKHYGRLPALLLRVGMVALGVARAALFGSLYITMRTRRAELREKLKAGWRLATAGLTACVSFI